MSEEDNTTEGTPIDKLSFNVTPPELIDISIFLRSLQKSFFIVDEAQNLTPHEIKTIISRAGENTKIVFAGDINQIDTPYLDSQSNGLSYLIDKLKGQKLYSHVTLRKGERSDLANLANELL